MMHIENEHIVINNTRYNCLPSNYKIIKLLSKHVYDRSNWFTIYMNHIGFKTYTK